MLALPKEESSASSITSQVADKSRNKLHPLLHSMEQMLLDNNNIPSFHKEMTTRLWQLSKILYSDNKVLNCLLDENMDLIDEVDRLREKLGFIENLIFSSKEQNKKSHSSSLPAGLRTMLPAITMQQPLEEMSDKSLISDSNSQDAILLASIGNTVTNSIKKRKLEDEISLECKEDIQEILALCKIPANST
jgi:regulator of replication initiation timing